MKHAKHENTNKSAKFPHSVIFALALLAVSAALYISAREIPGFADAYRDNVYPIFQGTYGRLTGIFPFSVSEMILLALPALFIINIIFNVRRFRIALKNIFVFLSIMVFLYVSNCGVNYYSSGFVDSSVYEEAIFTEDELTGFCEYIAGQLDENEAYEYSADSSELAEAAVSSMENLGSMDSKLDGYYSQPKRLKIISRLFSMMGVSGVYSPFTIEANINGEMPDMEKPFTACHELSHLRGYMNEGEANYIGWLACINSDDDSFNRSGWLIAWSYAGSELYRINPEKYAKIWESVPDNAKAELAENHEFWSTYENDASDIQDKVNDTYLKSNGIEDGVTSYSRVTTLMLLWFSGVKNF